MKNFLKTIKKTLIFQITISTKQIQAILVILVAVIIITIITTILEKQIVI